MTPAEYDTLRIRLGLSVPEVAALQGVQEKSVRRWCSGERGVPDDAADMLRSVESDMEADLDSILRLTMNGMVLRRYRTREALAKHEPAPHLPLGAHDMMIAWAGEILSEQGVSHTIEWAD